MGNSAGHEVDKFKIITEEGRSGHNVAVPVGGNLRGVASFEVKSPLQIFSVRIELVGRERTSCQFRDEVPVQTIVTHHEVMTVCGHMKSFRSSSMRSLSSVSSAGGSPRIARRLNSYSGRAASHRHDRPLLLPAGTYSIPFEFAIPSCIPPSLSYRSADSFFTSFTVSYELACCVRLAPEGRRLVATCPVQFRVCVPQPHTNRGFLPRDDMAGIHVPGDDDSYLRSEGESDDGPVVRTSCAPETSLIAQIRAILSRSWFALDGSDCLEVEVEVDCARANPSASPSTRQVEAVVASLQHRITGSAEGHPYVIHTTPAVVRKAIAIPAGAMQKITLRVPVPKKACASLPPSFVGRLMRSEWSLRVGMYDSNVTVGATAEVEVEFNSLSAVSGFCGQHRSDDGDADGNRNPAADEDLERERAAPALLPQDEPTAENTRRNISTHSLPRTPYSSVVEYHVPIGMESFAVGLDRLPPIIREDASAPEKNEEGVPSSDPAQPSPR